MKITRNLNFNTKIIIWSLKCHTELFGPNVCTIATTNAKI